MTTFLTSIAVLAICLFFAVRRMIRGSRRHRRRAEGLCLRMNALVTQEDMEFIERPVLPGEGRRSALSYLISRMQDHVSAIKTHRGLPNIAADAGRRSTAAALTQLALDIELLEMGASLPEIPVGHRVCCECWNAFPQSELIQFSDFHVCSGCKEQFLQKIKEGIVTEL